MTSPDFDHTIDLVRAAQGGDPTALSRLLERYYPRVHRIVRIRLGDRLRQRLDSGDILQETFAAAVRMFDRFEMRDDASLINWLAKIAERQISDANDYHGAERRQSDKEVALDARSATDSDAGGLRERLAADITQPLDKLARQQEQTLIEECLDELGETHRELIVLRELAGCSWSQVAKETGRPSADAARMMHAKALLELTKRVRDRQRGAAGEEG